MTARRPSRRPRGVSLGVLVGLACASPARAQSIVEDADGRTALLLPASRGLIGLNTGDGSVQLGLARLVNTRPVFWNAIVRAKSVDGVGTVFRAGDVAPDVGAAATLGYKPTGQAVLALRWRRDWATAALLDTTGRPVPRVDKRSANTYEVAGHVQVANTRFPVQWQFAAAVGSRRATNYGDLTKATLRSTVSRQDPGTGAVAVVEQTAEGRLGSLRSETSAFTDLDLLLVPPVKLPVTVRLFGRGLPSRPEGSGLRNAGGFDVGLHRPGGDALLDRLVAVVTQVDEVRGGDAPRALRDRTTVALVVNAAPVLARLLGGKS